MTSKKLQNILKKKIYNTTFFKEEYEVRVTNGEVIYVYVDVVNGINEKTITKKPKKLRPNCILILLFFQFLIVDLLWTFKTLK